MNPAAKPIIYTDLDGTFLDHHTYSFAESLPALKAAQSQGIPIVFCSSKTREEIEFIRTQAGVSDPFIVENGGAIYIPDGYFPFDVPRGVPCNGYQVIVLGTPYFNLVATLRLLRSGLPGQIRGFSDMTVDEIAAECNLPMEDAKRAKAREYDEPFTISDPDPATIDFLMPLIIQAGLRCSQGGRFYHLHGNNDKGIAIELLTRLFQRKYGEVSTIGLGDSLNDLPMLDAVDLPILVAKPGGRHDQNLMDCLPRVQTVAGIGPRGWQVAVTGILNEKANGRSG
ncbi:MAG: HAD-IIB family hydrolase [Blastocatellales bacterium]